MNAHKEGQVYYCDIFGNEIQKNPVLRNKSVRLDVHLHYTDPVKQKTIFGEESEELFYNYDDRIRGQKWQEGLKKAQDTEGVTVNSARYFEVALNHFHNTDDVNMGHIMVICNPSGFEILLFGYTYTSKK